MIVNNDSCALILKQLFFEKIEFRRIGNKNNNELELGIQVVVQKNMIDDSFKVMLKVIGNKKDEYTLDVQLSGIFSIDDKEKLNDEAKSNLIDKNAVAIMMPYMRSQLTLLTSQPGVDSVVLPPFNINRMMEHNKKDDD